MKGSRLGSAVPQTRNRNVNTNFLDSNKEDVSSLPQQNNVNNIFSGSSSSDQTSAIRIRAATATATTTQTKTFLSDRNTTTNTNPQSSNTNFIEEHESTTSNLSRILSKPSFSLSYTLQPKPRPEHPLPLISFPSTTTGGNNDWDNEVVTPTPPPISANAGSGKICGRISTAKELLCWSEKFHSVVGDGDNFEIESKTMRHSGRGGRDGWIASDRDDFHRAKTPFYNRVPKPSHSAKKLAKPYSILIPPNSANSSYSKSYYSSGTGRGRREVGNSPSAPTTTTSTTPTTTILPSASNNIDNKVANKPKRNKTARAETGLRKGLSTSVPNTLNNATKKGLLFFSDAKKVANTATTRKNRDEGNEEISEERQQSWLNGFPSSSSGLRLMSGESGQWKNWSTGSPNKSMSALSKKLNERVQVIRTAEEREDSPESIRMDGLGLKVFPYIGGGEGPCIKLLSLQRNLISHLENTPSHLNHLVVLDLYSNRIERLSGLLGFTSLRVLLLGKNRIRRIEGLENLKRLEILDLHGNQLRYVDNLGVLSSLRVLNLAGNLLRSIRNLGPVHGLTTLVELNLKRNRIRNLDGLVKAPNLKKLLLATNDLQSFSSLLPLRKLSCLEELLLEPNPLTSVSDYRHQLLTMIPWLQCMDRVGITEIMRTEARQWQKRKLAEEEERKKEEALLRSVPSPTGGPPNSREQAIYQAQRRWETVKKNFVKNTSSTKPTNPSSPSLPLSSEANEKRTFGQGQNQKDKIRTGGLVRSEIDDDLNSHFRSKSRLETLSQAGTVGNSSKESKSSQKQDHGQSSSSLVLLEYPGGEVKLDLAHLDSDLDQHQGSTMGTSCPSRAILVSSGDGDGNEKNIKRMPMPLAEELCPPSMINDLGPPQIPKDYVDTNSSDLLSPKQEHFSKWVVEKVGGGLGKDEEVGLVPCPSSQDQDHHHQSQVEDEEIVDATQSQMKKTNCGGLVQLLSSKPRDDDQGQGEYLYNSQMDSSIITNITGEVKSTQSPPDGCQPQWMMLTQILGAENEDGSEGRSKIRTEFSEGSANLTFFAGSPATVTPTYSNDNANNQSGKEKAMRIAVVRPLLRERTTDETIIISPPILIPPHIHTNNFLQPTSSLDPVVFSEPPPATQTEGKTQKISTDEISPTVPDTNQFPSISSPSDSDRDKIIQRNKSEIMTRQSDLSHENTATSLSLLVGEEEWENVTPRNMLRQNFSTCLPPVLDSNHFARKETTRPTFTFETLDQQSINKEEETRIINNNLTPVPTPATTTVVVEDVATFSSTTATNTLPPSANISQTSNTCTSSSSTTVIANANISHQTCPTPAESGRNSHIPMKPSLRKLRSASFDSRLLSSNGGVGGWDEEHYNEVDVDDDDTCSMTTTSTTTTTATGSNTTIATTSDVSPRNRLGFSRKQLFPRTKSQRAKLVRDRLPRAQSSSSINTTTRTKSGGLGTMSSSTQNMTITGTIGVNRGGQSGDIRGNKTLRRCESAVVGLSGLTGTSPLENGGNNLSPAPLKRQGIDYLVEIDGKVLSIYGQGALKHTLTGFSGNVTCTITTAKFHYISYDSIIPFFGKMRQIYPFLEHVQFRANNIESLSQLNSLSDLQGLTSLHIAKEGNPLVSQHDCSWVHYANYRLSHWGLKNVNGKEVSSEYRGGHTGSAKCFESLGFLALSCLPQTALTPLARRLHRLHCFCCCSPSSSSDESGKGKSGKPVGGGNGRATSPLPPDQSSSSGNICTSWDDDPVLLDVIGKEALVYCPSPVMRLQPTTTTSTVGEHEASHFRKSDVKNDPQKRTSTLNDIVESGVDVLEKLDRLEKAWPSLMRELVQEILLDFKFIDSYMKKELKKCQDTTTIELHKGRGS